MHAGRRGRAVVLGLSLVAAAWGGIAAAQLPVAAQTATSAPDASAPDATAPGGTAPGGTTVPGATTTRPAGTTTTTLPCSITSPVSLRFVGTVVDVSGPSARFTVSEVRAGELPNQQVVVRYDADARYLDVGTAYAVAAWAGGDGQGALTGRIRAGDEEPRCVAGRLTTLADGSDIDTGVLSPLVSDWRGIVRAVALPGVAAVLVLAVLVLAKRAVVRLARGPAPR